jgi:hypothetical protein
MKAGYLSLILLNLTGMGASKMIKTTDSYGFVYEGEYQVRFNADD